MSTLTDVHNHPDILLLGPGRPLLWALRMVGGGRQRRGDALKRHGWASLGGRGCHGNEITLPWTHWEPPEVLERESDQTRCGETTKAPESDGGWGRLGGAERPADSLGRQWPADGAAWVWALPCTHRGIRL